MHSRDVLGLKACLLAFRGPTFWLLALPKFLACDFWGSSSLSFFLLSTILFVAGGSFCHAKAGAVAGPTTRRRHSAVFWGSERERVRLITIPVLGVYLFTFPFGLVVVSFTRPTYFLFSELRVVFTRSTMPSFTSSRPAPSWSRPGPPRRDPPPRSPACPRP